MALSPTMGHAADLTNSSGSNYTDGAEGYVDVGEDTTQSQVSSKVSIDDVADTTYADTSEAEVYATKNSIFSVIIPKVITLDGSTKAGDYQVAVKGDLSGSQEISVTPDENVTLHEQNAGVNPKADVVAGIVQGKTVWNQSEIVADVYDGTGTTKGTITAEGITAGSWMGNFNFDITLKNAVANTLTFNANGGVCSVDTKSLVAGETYGELPTPIKAIGPLTMTSGGNVYTFSEIRSIAESGNADDYFDIGDVMSSKSYIFDGWYTKVNGGTKVTATTVMSDTDATVYAHWTEEKFEVAIADFNHDDLADGTGKAGITFSTVDCLAYKFNRMNSTNTNVGGWGASEMRSYLSTDVYNGLSDELKSAIKTVTKTTNAGNLSSSVTTTNDKLFLFSVDEVYGVSQSENHQVGVGNGCDVFDSLRSSEPEGTQYPYFQEKSNVRKYRRGDFSYNITEWWLRSPATNVKTQFRRVDTFGYCNSDISSHGNGIVFGFSI